jgi:hypothetical protein
VPRTTSSSFVLVALVGCTQWSVAPNYGEQTEVARRLLGAPQIEEVASSNVSAGFGSTSDSFHRRHFGTTEFDASLSGSHDSAKRVHCVQQAQIDYTQPVDYVTRPEHRALDVAGSVALGVAGLMIVGIAQAQYNSGQQDYEMNPSFFAKPSQPTFAYAAGGTAIVGAVVWSLYSFASLPKGPPPSPAPTTRAWTETTYVEATGCGLVPADKVGSP